MKVYSFGTGSDMQQYHKFYSESLSIVEYQNWSIITSHSMMSFIVIIKAFFKREKLLVFVHDQIPHPNFKAPVIWALNVLICIIASEIRVYSTPRGIFRFFKQKINIVKLPDILRDDFKFEPFAQSDLSCVPAQGKYVLMCGRYDKYKLHKGFIKSFESLVEYFDNIGIRLVIVGMGWSKSPIGFHPFIHDDYVSDKKLYSYICHCEFLLMPYSSATQSGFASIINYFQKTCFMSDLEPLREQFKGAALPIIFVKNWEKYECKFREAELNNFLDSK